MGQLLIQRLPHQMQGVGARSLLKRENSLPAWSGEDLASLVSRALWGFQSSPYLTPHIYQPAKEALLSACQLSTVSQTTLASHGLLWFALIHHPSTPHKSVRIHIM